MAPKATAAKFLVRAEGGGEWSCDKEHGEFRVAVDTDLASVVMHVGPDHLEEWNPVMLRSYSMRYLRGGSHLRISFEVSPPLSWKGELELNVFGGLAGKFQVGSIGGAGKVTGSGTVAEVRDHVHDVPRPSQALAQKLQNEPAAVKWEIPAAASGDGSTVLLVGLGGPSRSGKSVLAAAMAASLRKQDREVAVVAQSSYEQCVGTYSCSIGVNESMYEDPSAINWADFARGISKAIHQVAAAGCTPDAPALVIVEGSLVFWMPQISNAFHRRIFLRTSRNEVLRRRQSSSPLAEPFVEHVFWQMHMQYGQPQAPWEELRVEDGEEGHPAPEELVSQALGVIGAGAHTANSPVTDAAPVGTADGESAAPAVEVQEQDASAGA